MTFFRCSFSWLVLWLCTFFSVSALAETFPNGFTWRNSSVMGATKSTVYLGTQTNSCGGTGSLCSIEAAGLYAAYVTQSYCKEVPTIGPCVVDGGASESCTASCPTGAPYNSVWTGTVSVYQTSNVAAPPPPDPCPAAGTEAWGPGLTNGGVNSITVAVGASVGQVCIDGCAVTIGGNEVILPSGNGQETVYPEKGTYTGVRPASCDATPGGGVDPVDLTPAADTVDGVPLSQSDCPTGSAFGQVNGVNVCAPAGTKINYVPDTASSTNGGTTTDATTTKSDVVNENGTVTTTTTNASGGTSTTTNITNNYGSGFASGGGSSAPTSINLGPAPAAESGDVEFTLPGPGPGADGNGGAEKQYVVTGHFAGSQACIADRTVSAMGVDVVIPLSQLCPWFDMMYKIISMVGLFVALRILVMS